MPGPPPGYRLQPVHAWQRDTVLRTRYRDLFADGALRILDAELAPPRPPPCAPCCCRRARTGGAAT